MRRLKLWLALSALAAALAAGATAAVGGQHTSPVTATLSAVRVAILHEQTCTGTDGEYRVATESYAGAIAGDPRLTGIAAVYLTSITNTTTGNGTVQGAVLVTETGGHVRFSAVLQGVINGSGGLNLQGLLSGIVNDFGTSAGGRLVANFQAVRAGPTLYMGVGGSGTNSHPAVIQRGACQGVPNT